MPLPTARIQQLLLRADLAQFSLSGASTTPARTQLLSDLVADLAAALRVASTGNTATQDSAAWVSRIHSQPSEESHTTMPQTYNDNSNKAQGIRAAHAAVRSSAAKRRIESGFRGAFALGSTQTDYTTKKDGVIAVFLTMKTSAGRQRLRCEFPSYCL